MSQYGPLTPIRSPRHSSLNIYDSPFSDYFTDENRSVDEYSTPSSESQKLLLRLNTLGAEILRQDLSAPMTTSLGAKLDDFETVLRTPEAHSKRSSLLSDTGLGITDVVDEEEEEEEEEAHTTPSAPPSDDRPATPAHQQQLDGAVDVLPDAIKTKLRTQDRLLREAQEVLQRVSKANDSLRKRYDEIRRMHDSTLAELEEAAQEALTLKSENESLKADLGFDHSELLFMKLQLKALEVEADALSERLGDGSELMKERVLLNDDIDRWKADWDDVDARLRSRREKHGVVSTTPVKFADARDYPKAEEQGNWRLDMCKKRHGRVQSITIRRLNSMTSQDAEDSAEEDEDEEVEYDKKDEAVFEDIVHASDLEPKSTYCDQAAQTDEPAAKPVSCEQAIQTDEQPAKPIYCEQYMQTDEPAAKPLYCEQSIQTEDLVLPPTCEQAIQTEEPAPTPTSEQAIQTDELPAKSASCDQATQTDATCAPNLGWSATSSEPDSESEGSPKLPVKKRDQWRRARTPSLPKTAWQELCDSLSSFAGMDRE